MLSHNKGVRHTTVRKLMPNRLIRKRFKSKKVQFNKYVKDFYLEGGLAYISCRVSGFYDVIDRYSVNGYEWLAEGFARFIETNAYYIPIDYPIVLEISGTEFTPNQQLRIVETIQDYYALQLGDKQLDLNDNTHKAITLMILSICFFAFVWLLTKINLIAAFQEFVLVLFWFFVWEFCDLVLLERRLLRRYRTDAAQLASMKVIFRKKFTDNPVGETIEEQLIKEIINDEYEKERFSGE